MRWGKSMMPQRISNLSNKGKPAKVLSLILLYKARKWLANFPIFKLQKETRQRPTTSWIMNFKFNLESAGQA